MGRTINNNNRPPLRPVIKAELSEKNIKKRFALTIALAAVGAICIGFGIKNLVTKSSGWTEISVNTASEAYNGDEFIFLYNLGSDGDSATIEGKELNIIYSNAMENAYKLFNADQTYEDLTNIYDVNHHPNEEIEVDPLLYSAFETVVESGTRCLYMAPEFSYYDDIFYVSGDDEASALDPVENEERRDQFAEMAVFANDPDAVEIELLGDNKVELHVSEEYLSYADENDITNFVDFSWMKNAFIVDYIADTLTSQGYTNGSISSYDGFVRNLCRDNTGFSLNIYDGDGNTVYDAGTLNYSGTMSFVTLRNVKLSAQDDNHYYRYSDGTVRGPYLDASDGLPKASINNLTCYSGEDSCAQILMDMIPIYISDTFDAEALNALEQQKIYSVYCQDNTIISNDSSVTFSDLFDKDGVTYTVKQN